MQATKNVDVLTVNKAGVSTKHPMVLVILMMSNGECFLFVVSGRVMQYHITLRL